MTANLEETGDNDINYMELFNEGWSTRIEDHEQTLIIDAKIIKD